MPPAGSGSGRVGTAATRIKKEIAALSKEDTGSIKLEPNESNIFSWKAIIPGPAGSPYEGGEFEVDIRVPDDYPFSPPHLAFLTKVYHCNIASTGAICLDVLKTAWSPALSLYKVILSLSSLLTDPNPADPLVPAIAQELKRNKKKHDATAREWVRLYAMPKKNVLPPTHLIPPQPTRTNSATSSTSSRRAIPRGNPTSSPSPLPQIAGTRRSNPYSGTSGESSSRAIEVDDSDSNSDMEVVGETTPSNGRGRNKDRPIKRTRMNGSNRGPGEGAGPGSDDVIVIDD